MLPISVLPFGIEICHHSNIIKLPKVQASSTSIVVDKHLADYNPGGDRVAKML